jgi:hypothetical protein
MPHTENPSLRPAKRDTKGLCCDPDKAVIRGTGNPPNGFKNDRGWPDAAFNPRKKLYKNPGSKTIRAGKK